jgi:acetolactate synthase-1/2/3 large subunit
MERMSTAEATVATLLAHGLDTVYALPGVHNDFLFDAFFKAGEKLRVVHSRHEQGAGYMALGAALATNKPHAYAVVPGPGLLNTSAALLTAYSMNAPVLALIGQIPEADMPRIGHLHEIRDQAGIIAARRFSTRIRSRKWLRVMSPSAAAMARAGRAGRAGCAIDMWGNGVVKQAPPNPGDDH